MNNKIIVVGDLHGDWGRLNQLINQKTPSTILQCGDFGWWPKLSIGKPVLYGQQKPWNAKGIKPGQTTIYWCDGNHEDHWDLLNRVPTNINTSVWLYDRVYYMPRGTILALPDGRTVLFIGGADSIDKDSRMMGVDWFREELITQRNVIDCLNHKLKIDIVISHTCPIEFDVESNTIGKYDDPCRRALSAILEHLKPDLWYFGHWHKAQRGKYQGTYWQCLDYPGHSGQWWDWLQ